MRRLDPDEAAAVIAGATPIPSARPPRVLRASIAGRDPSGSPVECALTEGRWLVIFSSTTCDGCSQLAGLVADGTPGIAVLGAMREPESGLPDDAVSAFTAMGGRWVLGDAPFAALGVHAAPFFCVLEHGTVVLEGIPLGRAHVEAHVARTLSGRPLPDAVWLTPDP